MTIMPALFLGHGSPTNAFEQNRFTDVWQQLGKTLPRPKAILCISAHFYQNQSLVVTVDEPETIHDFYGFPQVMYEYHYKAPGSPALAQRVQELLSEAKPTGKWGLDHGAWSVLAHLYPKADIPVVQLSIDLSLSAKEQMDIGRRLSPLREEGVLILGSGNVVHNLRRVNMQSPPYPWADAFDQAIHGKMMAGDFSALEDYMSLPGAMESVPTNDHFVPLLYVLGAARSDEKVSAYCYERTFASLSMTSYLLEGRE